MIRQPRPLIRRDWWLLALVLLTAAVVRLGDLGRISEYQYDAATLSTLALDMARGQALPLLGIMSSAGIPNSPATVYVLALPYLFSDNPQVAVLFIAALNVAGVGLLWLLVHRYFNPTVAFVAGLAYALNPFAIAYSRAIWAQDYHTPFLLLGLFLALLGFGEGRKWAQAAALPVFIVGAQIHFAAWVLLPMIVWVILWQRRHIHPPALAIGIIASLLTLVPFAVGLAQGASGTSAEIGEVVDNLDSLHLRNKAALYAVRLATGLGGPWVGTPFIGVYDSVLDLQHPALALWLVIGLATVAGLLVVWKRWSVFWGGLLLLWTAVPFLVFLPNWVGVFPHYFVPVLPGLALSVGVIVEWLICRVQPRPVRAGILAITAGLLASQGVVYLAYLRAADTTAMDLHPTPLHYLLNVRDALRDYDDILISGGVAKTSGYDVWSALLHGRARCTREMVVASGGIAVFPPGAFAVITPPGALPPATGDLYRSPARFTVPLRPGEGEYTVDPFTAPPDWTGTALTAIDPVRFDNGVSLTGYAVDDERVYLGWLLSGRGSEGYRVFLHFLDDRGEKMGQQDVDFWSPNYWCPEDRLITWVDADIPQATSTLRVGLYALEDDGRFVNSSVLDSGGNPAGLWVDLTP